MDWKEKSVYLCTRFPEGSGLGGAEAPWRAAVTPRDAIRFTVSKKKVAEKFGRFGIKFVTLQGLTGADVSPGESGSGR